MGRRTAVLVALLALTIRPSPGYAQQIDLPELQADFRLQRVSWLTVSAWVGAIAYAKSVGTTPEELGRFWGGLYAQSWSGRRGQGPEGMIAGLYYNFASPADAEVEVLEASRDAIVARRNRPYRVDYFGDSGERLGVTVFEYEETVRVIAEMIAESLDLRYQERLMGDWIEFTISRRSQAAAAGDATPVGVPSTTREIPTDNRPDKS
jgi:hypothetical protein